MRAQWWIVLILATALAVLVFVNQDVFFEKNQMKHSMQTEQYFVPGKYEKYEEGKIELGGDKQVILFISATWCPTCSTFNEEMMLAAKTLPDNILILAIDYDLYPDLRQKYKVAYQHTFIMVDKDGNEIKRWSGGGVERLKRELGL